MNDVVLLVLLSNDLQLTLGGFLAKCEAAGMRISTSMTEAMFLSWKRWSAHCGASSDLDTVLLCCDKGESSKNRWSCELTGQFALLSPRRATSYG